MARWILANGKCRVTIGIEIKKIYLNPKPRPELRLDLRLDLELCPGIPLWLQLWLWLRLWLWLIVSRNV